jgi:hypothetical protein
MINFLVRVYEKSYMRIKKKKKKNYLMLLLVKLVLSLSLLPAGGGSSHFFDSPFCSSSLIFSTLNLFVFFLQNPNPYLLYISSSTFFLSSHKLAVTSLRSIPLMQCHVYYKHQVRSFGHLKLFLIMLQIT